MSNSNYASDKIFQVGGLQYFYIPFKPCLKHLENVPILIRISLKRRPVKVDNLTVFWSSTKFEDLKNKVKVSFLQLDPHKVPFYLTILFVKNIPKYLKFYDQLGCPSKLVPQLAHTQSSLPLLSLS